MTQRKKQKIQKQLILCAATRGTATNWRNPTDESRSFSNSLSPWIKLAKIAESGKLHSLFFVDHLSWFDVYGGSYEKAAQVGVNAARLDPTSVVSALAAATSSLGFSITCSTISEHPYHFARRIASLDHISDGRVGWNIVGSYLPSLSYNLLNGSPLPRHDERYDKSEEYLDVLYDLLLSSWRDDAIIQDREKGVFADPQRIRNINHSGRYFNVKGPAITEPSKQKFPLISQAGSSDRGLLFAAENAELIFIGISDYERTANQIKKVRKVAMDHFGRDPHSIKFIAAIDVYVAKTTEEAKIKQEHYKNLQDPEEAFVYFGGTSGIDLKPLDWDDAIPVSNVKTNGVQGTVDNIISKSGPNKTKKELFERRLSERTKFVGDPNEVADLIEDLIHKTDLDGLNFSTHTFPSELEDVVELLVPELQKRGIAQTEYAVPGGTLRENFYGVKGQKFFKGDHPAYKLKWPKDLNKEEFEKDLVGIKGERFKNREAAKFSDQ